jgi:hypothetical protein
MRYLVAVLILALAASCETAPEYFVLVARPSPAKPKTVEPAAVAKTSPAKPEEGKAKEGTTAALVRSEESKAEPVAGLKPEELKSVLAPEMPRIKPEEPRQAVAADVKPEQPRPVVTAKALPVKPDEPEAAVVHAPPQIKPEEGEARFVIVREKRFLMSGQKARIAINGKEVAELGNAETYAGVVAPGKTVLSVTSIQYGRYVIEIDAEPNKEYTFDVRVNNNFIAATYPRAGVLGGIGAYAADQIHKDGPFSITLKEVR